MDLKVKGTAFPIEADRADWTRAVVRGAVSEWLKETFGPFHRKAEFEADVHRDDNFTYCDLLITLGNESQSLRGIGSDLASALKQALLQLRSPMRYAGQAPQIHDTTPDRFSEPPRINTNVRSQFAS